MVVVKGGGFLDGRKAGEEETIVVNPLKGITTREQEEETERGGKEE